MQFLTPTCLLLLNMVLGQSLAQVTVIRCERSESVFWITNLELSCTGADVLHILGGNFGRTDSTVCADTPGTDTSSTDCLDQLTLDKIIATCQGQSSCTLPPTSDFFTSDPCPTIYKYLEVTYDCGPPTTASPTTTPGTQWCASPATTGEQCQCTVSDPTTDSSFPYVVAFDGTVTLTDLNISADKKRDDVDMVTTASGDDDMCKLEIYVTMKRNNAFPPAKVDIVHFSFGDHERSNKYSRSMKYIPKTHRLVENSPDMPESVSYYLADEQYEYSGSGISVVVTGTENQGFVAHSPECNWTLEYTRLDEEDVIQLAMDPVPIVGLCAPV